jgi:lipopolysaccharide/colanic/teichoic acid biosynthesis glycosyltransferase
MSLVGPRPLLMKYLPLYTPQQARRHDVRPGITGLAQVKGRNGLSWQERFELDLSYVEHCSLGLDLRILARTALEVLAGRGIAQPGRATVDDFQGTTSHG